MANIIKFGWKTVGIQPPVTDGVYIMEVTGGTAVWTAAPPSTDGTYLLTVDNGTYTIAQVSDVDNTSY